MFAMHFGDTDVDKDGKINSRELDVFVRGHLQLLPAVLVWPHCEKEYGAI